MRLTKTNHLLPKILAGFALVIATFIISGGRANAATMTVGAGGCTLSDAINSVNAGANTGSCTSTSGNYGTNDTISIPAGITTLTADLPKITEPVTVNGAGMDSTTISGNGGQYLTFTSEGVPVTFSNMKITEFQGHAIFTLSSPANFKSIEVDGQGMTESEFFTGTFLGIAITNDTSATYEVNVDDVYIHNMEADTGAYLNGLLICQSGDGTTNAVIKNTTISDMHNSETGASGLMLTTGAYGLTASTPNGTVNSNISNVTVDNTTSVDFTMPFSSLAISSGESNITTDINNITVTGSRGYTGTGNLALGAKSGAFYAAGVAYGASDEANVTVNVGNSLIADNLNNENEPNNCSILDLSPNMSGVGTVNAAITSLGHNVSDDDSCSMFTEEGDQQNLNNIISTLGDLQDNGGQVPTRALLANSPAIQAGGQVLGITTDARGVARPASNPDAGAYQTAVNGSSTDDDDANGAAGELADTGQNAPKLILLVVLIGAIALLVIKLKKKPSSKSKK